jgi:hypothetical protein
MKTTSLIIIIFVLFFRLQASGQYQSVLFWIKIHDTSGGRDSLVYGYNVNATFYADSAFGEFSAPPDAPGFFAKFTCPRSPAQGNWGLGLLHNDIRALPLIYSPLHLDTFCIYFKNDNTNAINASATLKWSAASCLSYNCDSMFILDPSRTILTNRVNMFAQDSIVLPDIYDPAGPNPRAPEVRFNILVYGIIPPLISECWINAFTDPADEIASESASLHGRVDVNCYSVDSVKFQYGTNQSYGYETRAVHGSGNQYSLHLTNLQFGTTYHYRIVVYGGTNFCTSYPEYGANSTFTTEPPSSIFWINVKDSSNIPDNYPDSLVFGNHVLATSGVDTSLGEYEWVGECFDYCSQWRERSGIILAKKDLHGLSSPTQKDTFNLYLHNNPDATNISPTIYWPSSSYLQLRTDSMYLVDPSHTLLPNPVDMFSTDSVILNHPYDPNGVNPRAPLVQLFIYKYGIHMPLIDLVKPEKVRKPTSFVLYQNYPNPFNPVTEIQFDIPTASDVSLKVFNILGQEVATLVNERRAPGRYFTEFDGSKFASGVYIYRMVTNEFIQTKKLLLIR